MRKAFFRTIDLDCGTHGSLFIDLDNFKAINDTLVHQEGDTVQVNTTAIFIFQHSFRLSDIISRVSGDELTIQLLDSPHRNIAVIMERLRQKIKRFNERKKKNPLSQSA